jgi:hypothetical protein
VSILALGDTAEGSEPFTAYHRGSEGVPGPGNRSASRPLSALLSQILVAYTVELDDRFELAMSRGGYPGARLSLVVWTNLVRFVTEEGTSVGDLQSVSSTPGEMVRFQLGCLERWGYIHFPQVDAVNPGLNARPGFRREGWGSGRGINSVWVVRLTSRGRHAAGVWPRVWPEVERRWMKRFGPEYGRVHDALRGIERRREVELPLGLVSRGDVPASETYQPRESLEEDANLPLSALLSRVLLMFTTEFNRRSKVPISLCANTIRVLSPDVGTRVGDLPRLTGCSPEACGIGWFLKRFVAVENDPSGKRGKVARLSPAGVGAQNTYHRLASEIEEDWERRFGSGEVGALRSSLEDVLAKRRGGRPVVGLGMVPPDGTTRAGSATPALGRRELGVAAKQRGRDLAEQTKLFVANPEGSLPHYPLWDMNRGFGP